MMTPATKAARPIEADCTAEFKVMNVPRKRGSTAEEIIAMPGIIRPLMTVKNKVEMANKPQRGRPCERVVAIKGTAALWSPKVLRAGMGAHFGLKLVESVSPSDVAALQVPVLSTSSHEGPFLHEMLRRCDFPSPCAWVFGHEGQGVSEDLLAMAQHSVRIAQPGGEESLNVATAAAICLHASATVAL